NPQSFVSYLGTSWLPVCQMWSKVVRKGRNIYEEGDTNMLIESVDCFDECNLISNLIRYHHVLKSHWLDGKRNQRIDHLIHMLVEGMIPYYETRHLREVVGLEGPDL
ncbi:hypothetical protein BC827DRAFT_1087020, partial [Russula dissimulans]